MNYKDVLRYQPELRFANQYDISTRMLELTKGDLFVAYNVIKATHEVHSVENYKQNCISFNVALEPQMVNGFLFNDYKLNNLKMFVNDVKNRRDKTNYLYDKAEEESQAMLTSLDIVERTLGTKL